MLDAQTKSANGTKVAGGICQSLRMRWALEHSLRDECMRTLAKYPAIPVQMIVSTMTAARRRPSASVATPRTGDAP